MGIPQSAFTLYVALFHFLILDPNKVDIHFAAARNHTGVWM